MECSKREVRYSKDKIDEYEVEEGENEKDEEQEDETVLNIAEAYVSIQGEGIYVGMPSLFIRFVACNLCCTWCDEKGLTVDPGWNLETINKLLRDNAMYDLVITGGEPMVQPNALKHIVMLAMHYKKSMGYNTNITVETNGTISPLKAGISSEIANNVLWSVSPKMRSSGQNWQKVQFIDFLTLPKVQWKFPINPASSEDLVDFETILLLLNEEIMTIIAQPITGPDMDTNDYASTTRALIDYILKNHPRIRVIPQTHKFIFGMNSKSI
jgi:7-carboxy-7-deazaguanine synthase